MRTWRQISETLERVLVDNNTLCPGEPLHLHPPVPHGVLPAAGGDHPPHLPRGAAPGQARPLHHDPRHIQVIVTVITTLCAEKMMIFYILPYNYNFVL